MCIRDRKRSIAKEVIFSAARECELFYWRERNREVDFVVTAGRRVVAIEVKSGRSREMPVGLAAFTLSLIHI